ncbi:MAG: DNA pilot protein [Arizlama microvirus]|nr:MAG: DNA pilot protein [Arizlama microvirus]
MVFPLLGPIIGGIASIAGAGIAAGSASSAARASNRMQAKMNAKNLKYQKQFAQKGIRWRVKDARKAGIHPLAALGAQTPGFSPSFEAGNGPEIRAAGGAAAGNMVASAGQDFAGALSNMGDMDQKLAAMQYRMMDLQIKNQELQNAGLASKVATFQQAGSPPAYPADASRYSIPGQASTLQGPLVVDVPMQRIVTRPGETSREPGAVPEIGNLQTTQGVAPAMSLDAKQRLEEDTIGTLQWNLRNRIMPMIDNAYRPPGIDIQAPFNPITGVYGPVQPIIKKPYQTDGNMSDAFDY